VNEVTLDADTHPVLLRLSGVWKRFPGVVALKDVSFEVSGGGVHALLGENGAGKSTLMMVASGSIAPDSGIVDIAGTSVKALSPIAARRLGVAIVHQEPALLPDLTVAENLFLAVPEQLRAHNGSGTAWAKAQLERVGCDVDLGTRMEDVGVAQRLLIELAKALAFEPRVLILDEPTAPLGADRIAHLFDLVRGAAERGVAVVYISHRLPEVREIAQRVTVMRDGEIRGTAPIDDISDREILELIIGRAVSHAFPPKANSLDGGRPGLVVEGMSGLGFHEVALEVRPGEIVGLAGIAGNGQSEFVRALAGLVRASGQARLGEKTLKLGRVQAARRAGITYLSADRHGEGLLKTLSVRENAALSALPQFASNGVVQRRVEVARVEHEREVLNIRTPSIERAVATLSGGNQQKVALARSLLAKPSLVLVDEPTQGVDAGARLEIYRILREVADSGVPVLVVSSDGLELAGLCDRVVIFSRGQVVRELDGDDVKEANITHAIVTATTQRKGDRPEKASTNGAGWGLRLRQFARGDFSPSLVLLLVIAVLGIYTYSVNDRVLSAFNIGSALTLLTALALMSIGQLATILTGGIDISVGPLAGLLVVVASFFVLGGKSDLVIALGFLVMLGVALAVGLVNGALVRFGGFTPVAATLAMFIALQGVSLLLRPERGGVINGRVADAIQTRVGSVPIAFIVVVALVIVLEYLLRFSRWGLGLRAAGSQGQAAHRLGVPVGLTIVGAYVLCAFFVFLGAIMLAAEIQIGDPVAGIEFTLASITAVVLGGASLFGGRGSVVGTLLGAALIQQILNATVFLRLSQAWQFWFLGMLTLIAAAVYSQARRVGRA
jgi:ribose transport system ATP-binding protein